MNAYATIGTKKDNGARRALLSKLAWSFCVPHTMWAPATRCKNELNEDWGGIWFFRAQETERISSILPLSMHGKVLNGLPHEMALPSIESATVTFHTSHLNQIFQHEGPSLFPLILERYIADSSTAWPMYMALACWGSEVVYLLCIVGAGS